jgi:putative oxidoreductase
MGNLVSLYDRLVGMVSGKFAEALALLITRVALAGIFWRSYKTKIEEGTWFDLTDTTYFLFENEYSGVPIPPDIAAPMAAFSEFLFPILLVLGLATRFAAVSLLGMTLVIQIFVYPDAWWSVHLLWVAMASILIVRGGGLFSADALVVKARGQ